MTTSWALGTQMESTGLVRPELETLTDCEPENTQILTVKVFYVGQKKPILSQ